MWARQQRAPHGATSESASSARTVPLGTELRVNVDSAKWVAVQAMDIMAGEIASIVHILAVDVQQELADSYPAQLKRTALRKIATKRPSPLARLRAQSLLVKKFENLTPMQRHEHAKVHAALMPRALRLADMLVMGAMLDLALTSVDVRPSFPVG